MPEGAKELNTPLRLTAGAMAGITSVVMTYPLDITRTRLSVQSSSLVAPKIHTGDGPVQLPGMFPTIVHIYRTEGRNTSVISRISTHCNGSCSLCGNQFCCL